MILTTQHESSRMLLTFVCSSCLEAFVMQALKLHNETVMCVPKLAQEMQLVFAMTEVWDGDRSSLITCFVHI